MNYRETQKFQKDLKRFCKKYSSLDEDLEEFKKVLSIFPLGRNKHFAILKHSKNIKVAKARLFCRTLKGSSLRVVYAYHEQSAVIEFIEVYYIGEQAREDSQRIEDYLAFL